MKPTDPPLGIVMMGASGTGKSTLGRLLADALAVPFLEGDDAHPPANRSKMAAGIALDDADRWPWLDALAVELGAAARGRGAAVCACSALKRAYRDRLRDRAAVPLFFVCLVAEPALLGSRMRARVGHFMPASLLASQLATLELPDASERALIVDSGLAQDALLARIGQALRAERPGAPPGR